jgi:peptidoglycan/LPS O-acetylase OafA/YrhL
MYAEFAAREADRSSDAVAFAERPLSQDRSAEAFAQLTALWSAGGGMTGVRVGALDGIRGVAILLVIAEHAKLPLIRHGGGPGVTVFFVLSGYLITRLLSTELRTRGRVEWSRFYLTRAARLLPALAAASLGAFLYCVVLGGVDPALFSKQLTWVWVNFADFAANQSLGPWAHGWSLSLEAQFYLLWPAVLAVAWRSKWLPAAVLAAAAASAGLRIAHLGDSGQQWEQHFTLPHLSAFALLLGAWLALRPVRLSGWVVAPALTGLVVISATSVLGNGREVLSVLLAAPLAVLLIAGCDGARLLELPLLRHCGRVSYGWYLWHYPLIWPVTIAGRGNQWVLGAALSCLALGIALLSYRYVEQPAIAYVKRWIADRARRPLDVPLSRGRATRRHPMSI